MKQCQLYSEAVGVNVSEDTLSVDLADGRTISVPVAWYPRLSQGTADERNHWRLIGNGGGIHWPVFPATDQGSMLLLVAAAGRAKL